MLFKSMRSCPTCKAKLTWRTRRAMSGGWSCRRRIIVYPNCSALLTWFKWPWRILGVMSLLLLPNMVWQYYHIYSVFAGSRVLVYPLWPVTIAFDLLGFVVLLAVFRLRVVIAEKK
jgi:hypothetical protein